MSLAEAIVQAERSRSRPCKLGRALLKMDDDDREAFAQAVSRGVEWSTIHRAVVAQGHVMTYSTVRRHLAGDCGCDG